jgi:hypothetical protein
MTSGERLEIAPALWKTLLLGGLCSGFIGIGYWMISRPDVDPISYFIGWVSMLFFGACGILWIIQTIRYRGAVIVIDGEGILDRRVSDRAIPWTEVDSVSIWSMDAQRCIILKLDEAFDRGFATKAITRLTRGANRKLGADGITINPAGLEIGFDALLDAIITSKTRSDERHGQS